MHKTLARLAIGMFASVVAMTAAVAQTEESPARLDCTNGPLAKTFGASPWLVFGCSDGSSVVVVSTKDNRAHPFYFKLFLKEGKRFVVGEGTGAKAVTAAAYMELDKLSEPEIKAMIDAAMAAPNQAVD